MHSNKIKFVDSFTVLMSMYSGDCPNLFEAAMSSVFNQSLKPENVLLVCDGPLTNELEIKVKDFLSRYPKALQILRLPKNVGLAKALNSGLQVVTTYWVARADADDINMYNRFEETANFLAENPEVVLMGGAIRECDTSGLELAIRKVPLEMSKIRTFCATRNPFNHMTTVYQTDVIKGLGGYPDIYLREDYGLWAKLIGSGHKTGNTNTILVKATTGENFYKRRGGFQHIYGEIRLQRILIKYKIKSFPKGILDFFLRSSVFIAPSIIRKFVYNTFLR